MTNDDKLKLAILSNSYQVTKDIGGVPAVFKTLLDSELAECLHRSVQHSNVDEQVLYLPRWKLAYSLIRLNDVSLPTDVEERFSLINSWLNFLVDALIVLHEEVIMEERELAADLKNWMGRLQKN